MSATSSTFVSAVLLGLVVAVPVGPVALLCMTRSLNGGFAGGILTGLGAASIHATWAFGAALGLQQAGVALTGNGRGQAFSCLAAAILVSFGWRAFRSRRPAAPTMPNAWRDVSLASYGSGAALAVANPLTAALFVAAIPSLALSPIEDGSHLAWAGGTFVGSAGWWLLLSGTIAVFRARISERWILWTNRGAGLALMSCGALLLVGRGWQTSPRIRRCLRRSRCARGAPRPDS